MFVYWAMGNEQQHRKDFCIKKSETLDLFLLTQTLGDYRWLDVNINLWLLDINVRVTLDMFNEVCSHSNNSRWWCCLESEDDDLDFLL